MLHILSGLSVIAVCLMLVASSSGGEKKKKAPTVNGKVVSVELKDGEGTLTVKVPKKKNTEAKDEAVEIKKDTKVLKASTEKGVKPADGTPADLAKDQNVQVTLRDGSRIAERVLIQASKKKKN